MLGANHRPALRQIGDEGRARFGFVERRPRIGLDRAGDHVEQAGVFLIHAILIDLAADQVANWIDAHRAQRFFVVGGCDEQHLVANRKAKLRIAKEQLESLFERQADHAHRRGR